MSTFSNPLTEYSPQLESPEFLQESEYSDASSGRVFTETDEMELAAQLLEVRDEQELDHFLGDLIRKVGSVVGKIVGAPAGNAIGGILKSVAGKVLPIAGGALGGVFGGPLGAQVGSALASQAGSVFGLELEGLSPEDREFAATRQFVRFAGATVSNAMDALPGRAPDHAVYEAAMDAAWAHAPGLVDCACPNRRTSGQWIRRHGRIILLGI